MNSHPGPRSRRDHVSGENPLPKAEAMSKEGRNLSNRDREEYLTAEGLEGNCWPERKNYGEGT